MRSLKLRLKSSRKKHSERAALQRSDEESLPPQSSLGSDPSLRSGCEKTGRIIATCMPVQLSLQNKVAVITGGSRGIGAACVRMFVEAGAKVVFNYHKDRQAADDLVRSLGPDVCHSVQADLSSAESARPLIAAAVKQFGRVDAVVGNHGI